MAQQQPIIGVDMTQQDYNNLQQQGLLPSQLQQPQVVDVAPHNQPQPTFYNAGAQRTGIDWGAALQGLGNYMAAAGQGINPNATTMGAGLSGAADTVIKHQQAINQYNTMAPYYKQMGYDVSKLNPSRGGAGVDSTPEKMIELQSLIKQREYLDDYRRAMAEGMLQKQQGTQGGKVVTVGQLMMLSPEFKNRMQGQYDFSGGQNADLLNQQIPTSLLQGYMPAKKTSINYSGGTTSKQVKSGRSDIYHHSNGGSGGGSKKSSGSKKLIF